MVDAVDARHRPRLFVGGSWTDPRGGSDLLVRSPATGKPVGSAWLAGVQDADEAVRQAAAAFADGGWRDTPPGERAAVLRGAADRLQARADEAVDVLTSNLRRLHSELAPVVDEPSEPELLVALEARHSRESRRRSKSGCRSSSAVSAVVSASHPS